MIISFRGELLRRSVQTLTVDPSVLVGVVNKGDVGTKASFAVHISDNSDNSDTIF